MYMHDVQFLWSNLCAGVPSTDYIGWQCRMQDSDDTWWTIHDSIGSFLTNEPTIYMVTISYPQKLIKHMLWDHKCSKSHLGLTCDSKFKSTWGFGKDLLPTECICISAHDTVSLKTRSGKAEKVMTLHIGDKGQYLVYRNKVDNKWVKTFAQ